MKKRAVVATILTVGVLVSACGKNKEPEVDWQSEYTKMQGLYNGAYQEAEDLKRILANYDEKYKEAIDMSQYTVLNTGELDFNSFDNKIWLNSQVSFNAAEPLANDSKINILPNLSIQPSDRWTIQINTSDTQLSHTNGIAGQFMACAVYNTVSQAFIKDEYIAPFLQANSLQISGERTIFSGNSPLGTEITTRLKVTDSMFGTEHRMIRNDAIYTAEELAEMQSAADEAVKASEAARVAELESAYYESQAAESTEAQTNEAGEEIPPPAFVPPETIGAAPDVSSGEVDVVLPRVSTELSDYIYRIGVILFGDKGVIYQFVYKDDANAANNEEILDSLITSMKVDTIPIKLQ